MKRILFLTIALIVAANLCAQPKKSRVAENKAKTTKTAKQPTDRASIMFPTAVAVPNEVPWRRDVYRELDLTQDENAALYYPVEPQNGDVNLFTLLFRLLNVGKIPAYEYKMNGLEDFSKANRMHFKDMLDNNNIYYEIDGKSINVADADVPSAEVLSYLVKESSYYDENTATYHTRVVAICPVLHDYLQDQKRPLFWCKIEDIEPYLAQKSVMYSNLNNAARISMSDFFATNKYKGTIYMTNNMQGKALQEIYPSEAEMKKEQTRIEKEMTDFEEHIWTTPVDSAEMAKKDSIEAAQKSSKKARKAAAKEEKSTAKTSRSSRRSSASKSKNSDGGSSSSSGAPRASVRRQRH